MKAINGYFAHDKSSKGRGLFLSIVLILFLFVFPAFAQTIKDACPGIDQNATAAEHAICWFQLLESDSPECKDQKDRINPCIERINAWCAEASFDEESVATACLLTAIRAGRLKEAKEISVYLRTPSKTAQACMSVLTLARVPIVTNPSGAEVIIDDRSRGKAPFEVTLPGDWWESDIKARFATDPEPTIIAVSSDELLNAFDKEDCVFGDLVITGPKLEPSTSQQANQTANTVSDSDWLLWTSISLAVAGVASGAAATLSYLDGESDFDYLKKVCPAPGCYEGDINTYVSSMKEKYTIGNIFLVAGSVGLAASVVLTILYFAGTDNETDKPNVDLAVGSTKLKLKARF